MKPSETKDESMQRADTQSPLRCSSPASSEAQPDHCRKDVQKVGSQRHSQWHPVSIAKVISSACRIRPRGTWERGAAHGGRKNGEEERVVPSRSNPDALQRREKGGLKKETKLSSSTMVTCRSQKVRRLFV